VNRISFIRLAAVLAVFAVLPGNLRAQAPSRTADSLAIVGLEHAWLGASDSAALDTILAPDFVHPVPSGDFLTRAQHIHWNVTHPRPRDRHVRFGKLWVRVYGDVAIANGTVIATDATGKVVGRTVFTDVFARRHGRWQAVNGQENQVRAARPPH
jgi:Domain of unknown function (DUF4440)